MIYNDDPTKAIFFQRNELKSLIKECIREESGSNSFNSKNPDNDVLNIVQAAKLLHLSESTIYKHTQLGLLKKLYPEIRKNTYHREELLRFSKDYLKK